MATPAAFAPLVNGWKVAVTVVDAPAASVVVPGAPTAKSEAFAPETVNGGVSVTAAALMFLIVRLTGTLAPAGTGPKLSEAGVTTIGGVTALARFCGSLG